MRPTLLLVLAGCNDANSDSNADSDVDSDAVGVEYYDLESCETVIDDGLAGVFRWFRCATVQDEGDTIRLQSIGLPPHLSFYYEDDDPNHIAWDSRGNLYSPNPNRLSAQDLDFSIPVDPIPKGLVIDEAMVDGVVGTNDEEYPMGAAGLALDGVALFNPLAAPNDDIDDEQWTFDPYSAHPSPDLTYHYHTTSPGPLDVLVEQGLASTSTPGEAEIEVYGVFCDGTFVLGCTELNGNEPSGELDAQNGHVHTLVDADGGVFLEDRYHVHLCPALYPDHPYTPEIAYYENECSGGFGPP